MKKVIITDIIINANPEKVWNVLTNFEEYPSWNPFISSITGKVEVGNKIKVKLPEMTFTPKVLAFDQNREFRWLGNLLFPGIFDGEHKFKLIDNGDGTTTFLHSENFEGILVSIFSKKLDTDTKEGFKLMNLALKRRVEQNV